MGPAKNCNRKRRNPTRGERKSWGGLQGVGQGGALGGWYWVTTKKKDSTLQEKKKKKKKKRRRLLKKFWGHPKRDKKQKDESLPGGDVAKLSRRWQEEQNKREDPPAGTLQQEALRFPGGKIFKEGTAKIGDSNPGTTKEDFKFPKKEGQTKGKLNRKKNQAKKTKEANENTARVFNRRNPKEKDRSESHQKCLIKMGSGKKNQEKNQRTPWSEKKFGHESL